MQSSDYPTVFSPENPSPDAFQYRVFSRFDRAENNISQLQSDVAVLKSDVSEIKHEQRSFRHEVVSEFKEIRRDMRSDFRILFSALITVALGLTAIMARGFHWL